MHFIPNHRQPYLSGILGDGVDPGRFPAAEAVSQRIVSLPLYPALRDEQVDRVCEAVTSLARRRRRHTRRDVTAAQAQPAQTQQTQKEALR